MYQNIFKINPKDHLPFLFTHQVQEILTRGDVSKKTQVLHRLKIKNKNKVYKWEATLIHELTFWIKIDLNSPFIQAKPNWLDDSTLEFNCYGHD